MKKIIFTTAILLATLFLGSGNSFAQTANEPGSGNALLFFETQNDWVGTASNNTLDTYQQGAVEFWVKIEPGFTNYGIFTYSSVSSNQSLFAIYVNYSSYGGHLVVQYKYQGSKTPTLIGSTVFARGKWYHIAVTADGVNPLKAYINGVPETWSNFITNGTSANGSEWFADINLVGSFNHYIGLGQVGGDLGNPSGSSLNGILDEVRIWNRALTQAEIRQNMTQKLTGNEPGLVGYWRFDEGSGNTAYDSSPNGNNGTLY